MSHLASTEKATKTFISVIPATCALAASTTISVCVTDTTVAVESPNCTTTESVSVELFVNPWPVIVTVSPPVVLISVFPALFVSIENPSIVETANSVILLLYLSLL